MKVLLVNPINNNAYQSIPDLGLGYLAAALKKENHSVTIIDCINKRMSFQEFSNLISSSDFNVVGFKVFSSDLPSVKKSLRIVKLCNAKITTIVGGIQPSILPEETLKYLTEADFGFRGEAEVGLPELINNLPVLSTRDKERIPGLIWRNAGIIISNPQYFTENLDSLVMPDWELIHPRNYNYQNSFFTKSNIVAPLMVTRGCPYHCSFCSCQAVTGKRIRAHSINYIIDEIRMLYTKFNIREFSFIDDNLIANKEILRDLCLRMIEESIKIDWSCFGIRIDLLDRETLKLMEDAGCYLISVGIESGSQRILDHMQKKLRLEDIREKAALVKKSTGINLIATLIIGYPYEEREDILKTIKFVRSLPLFAVAFYGFHPIPGTPIYEELIASRAISEKIDWSSYGQDKKPFVPKGMTSGEFLSLYRWAYISFYIRPRVLFNILKEVHSMEKIKFLLNRTFGRLFA